VKERQAKVCQGVFDWEILAGVAFLTFIKERTMKCTVVDTILVLLCAVSLIFLGQGLAWGYPCAAQCKQITQVVIGYSGGTTNQYQFDDPGDCIECGAAVNGSCASPPGGTCTADTTVLQEKVMQNCVGSCTLRPPGSTEATGCADTDGTWFNVGARYVCK
jgi:hypothetical protein